VERKTPDQSRREKKVIRRIGAGGRSSKRKSPKKTKGGEVRKKTPGKKKGKESLILTMEKKIRRKGTCSQGEQNVPKKGPAIKEKKKKGWERGGGIGLSRKEEKDVGKKSHQGGLRGKELQEKASTPKTLNEKGREPLPKRKKEKKTLPRKSPPLRSKEEGPCKAKVQADFAMEKETLQKARHPQKERRTGDGNAPGKKGN